MPSHPKATPVAPPADCAAILPGHQFADAFMIAAPAGIDAIAATKLAFARSPLWIKALMAMRDGLGSLVGLKPAPAGGFPVIRESAGEVLLGFDDRHLDFRVLVRIADGQAVLTTIVHWHNGWGRAYLRLIMPFHRVIAARMLEGVA